MKPSRRAEGIELIQAAKASETRLGMSAEALQDAGRFWVENGFDILRTLKESHEDATRKDRAVGLKKYLEMDLDRIAERIEHERLV